MPVDPKDPPPWNSQRRREFKLDGTAEESLAQISARGHTLSFAAEGRQTVRIGINFEWQIRYIDRCLIG